MAHDGFCGEQGRGTISIVSPIHNLAGSENCNVYSGIEYVFERMLPLFNKFKTFRERENNSFQVIVKAQRY